MIVQFWRNFTRNGSSSQRLLKSYSTYLISKRKFCESMEYISVHGWHDRRNDILVQPSSEQLDDVTVFFCGDIQDFEKEMFKNSENMKYAEWSLEKTSVILKAHFPKSNILLVRPSRKYLFTFSCFDNFVHSEEAVPKLNHTHGALVHLFHLLKNINEHFQTIETSSNPCQEKLLPLRIIGFSKGCIVLNQIIYEMHHLSTKCEFELDKNEKNALSLVKSIKELCWLDGGHNGVKDIYVNNKSVLSALVTQKIKVQVHVTPYQINCKGRPWVGKQYHEFIKVLKSFNVKYVTKIHFQAETPSILRHFQVLEAKDYSDHNPL